MEEHNFNLQAFLAGVKIGPSQEIYLASSEGDRRLDVTCGSVLE
jgi:hypothetical protein